MSNIMHIEVAWHKAEPRPYITSNDLEKLMGEIDADLPENCFLREMSPLTGSRCPIPLTKFWWDGEHSAWTWEDVFIKKVAPLIKGEIEAYVIWDDGDITGLRIDNGKVSEPEVLISLESEEDDDGVE